MKQHLRSRSRRPESDPRPRTACRVAIATALIACPGLSHADVWPEAPHGVPEQVRPQFQEVGAPTFVTPAGDQTASSTQTPGASDSQNTDTSSDGTGSETGSVASGYMQYVGRSVGSGQCVALLQTVDPSVGLTATWRAGGDVQGNTLLQPGTMIATFDSSGRYANATDGSSHAAIYLGQNAQGIQVLDQWSDHAASVRTIRWNNASGVAADTGSQFRVITH